VRLVFELPLGSRITVSRSGPAITFAIRFWNGSKVIPHARANPSIPIGGASVVIRHTLPDGCVYNEKVPVAGRQEKIAVGRD
jgi:hypothetical protein